MQIQNKTKPGLGGACLEFQLRREDQFWTILVYMANLRLTPEKPKGGKRRNRQFKCAYSVELHAEDSDAGTAVTVYKLSLPP